MAKEASQKSGKSYLFEIHFLRAFACLAVVAVHVSATNSGMNNDTYDWFSYFLNQIGRFGTPIFAVISGFLLFFQVRNKGFQFGKFMKSRFSKVIIPFILWSVAYRYMMYVYNGQGIGDPIEEIGGFIQGNAFYHLYFISIVVQFYLVFPLLQKLFRTQTTILIFLFISFLISYNLYGIKPPFEGPIGEFIASKSFMPIWIFYFAFGAFLAYYWEGIRNFAQKRPVQMLILALAVSAGAVIEYNMKGYVSNRRLSNLANIPLLSIAAIGIYPLLAKFSVIKHPLVLIGKYSMGIYLIHPMVLYLMARHLPEPYWNVQYVGIMYIAVMIICVAAIRLITFVPLTTFLLPVPKIKKTSQEPPANAADASARQPA
ncbi:acyltransferase [Metabacillus sp. KIGAM252]|uniref:Acyltransferase n=1 Tax=Metabacillus flavus TaxID=2823519 RepID=A0ABS5LBX1_9BACI|nr:acyltransferase [Metabacillus flavus]MBS2968028.1 acyltransferase [Metabacillus flavus]